MTGGAGEPADGVMQPASSDGSDVELAEAADPAPSVADAGAATGKDRPAAGSASSAADEGDSSGQNDAVLLASLAEVRGALNALSTRVAEVEAVLNPADAETPPLVERADEALGLATELITVVESLAEAVEVAVDKVDKVEQAVTERERKRREHQRIYRFELHDVTDPQVQAKLLDLIAAQMSVLGEWVTWLVRTYRLWAVIPSCWAGHPLLLEELAGLRVAWAGAWTDPEARHDAVVVFHEQLWRFRERAGAEQWGSPTCTGGAHEISESYVEWAGSGDGVRAFEQAVESAQLALIARGVERGAGE